MSLKRAIFARVLRSVAGASILIGAAISLRGFAQERFPEIDPLAFTDHRGETFEGFDFRGRDLSLGKYEGAKLQGASFSGAELDRVTFDGADLRETSGWSEADLGLGIQAAGATCAVSRLVVIASQTSRL